MKNSIEKIAARVLEKQEITKALPSATKYDESRTKLPLGTMAGTVGAGFLGNLAVARHIMPDWLPPGEDMLPDMEFDMPDGSKWSPPKKTYPTEIDQKHLYDSLDESMWSKHVGGKPVLHHRDPLFQGTRGPYSMNLNDLPEVVRDSMRDTAKFDVDKPYVYVPRTSSPEILAHELGHSLESRPLHYARMLGGITMSKPWAIPANIASVLAYRADKKHPGLSDATVYGLGGAGALGLGATLGNEFGASLKGYKLMKQVGLKPRVGKAFIPNLSYLTMGALMNGIPMTLAAKRFIDNRKRDSLERAAQAPTPGLLRK
jgi:hypothetical protein